MMRKHIFLITVFLLCGGTAIYLVGRKMNAESPPASATAPFQVSRDKPSDESHNNPINKIDPVSVDTVQSSPDDQPTTPFKSPTNSGPLRLGLVLSSRIATDDDPNIENFLAWLEATLSGHSTGRGEVVWVERQHLAEVLDEQALALALDMSSSPSVLRDAFSLLDAERLIFIRPDHRKLAGEAAGVDELNILATVVDSSTGIRLHSQELTLHDYQGQGFAEVARDLIAAAVRPISKTTLLAVSPVSDARLLAMDNKLGRRLEDQIAHHLARPGRLQLELSEAQALSTEILLRGDGRLSATWQPWYVFLRLSDHRDQSKLNARAVLQHNGQIISDWTAEGDATDTRWIAEQLCKRFDPIIATARVTPQNHTDLVARLRTRAKQLQATAQTAEALELIETAILYEPDNDKLRDMAMRLLAELMTRTADQYAGNRTKANRQLMREAAPQLDEWHARGLEHVWHMVLKTIDTQRGVRLRDHYTWKFSGIHQSLPTLDLAVREDWYEIDSLINLPMQQRAENFYRRVLSLIDRIGPQPLDGSLTNRAFTYAWPERVKIPESSDLIRYRFEVMIRHACKLPESKQVRRPPARTFDKFRQSKQYLDELGHAIAVADSPLVLYVLETQRAGYIEGLIYKSPESIDKGAVPAGWPADHKPAATLPVTAETEAAKPLPPAEGYARWLNPSALPSVRPTSILKKPRGFSATNPRFFANCGQWGDLVWDDDGVYLLTAEGKLRVLIPKDEMPDDNVHWVRNVSFDGRDIWVLLPGADTRVLLIDPATGNRREFNADAGLPPSDTGGSVVAVDEGVGIAFGSFGSDSTVRTWYARLTLENDQLKTEILRSDKSQRTAETPTRSLRINQLRAFHTGQMALCEDPDNPERRIVVGELSHWVLNHPARSRNHSAYFSRINPKTGTVHPGYMYDSSITLDSCAWIPLNNGQIFASDYGANRMYNPFDDYETMPRGRIRLDELVDTPIGQFVVETVGSGLDQTSILCHAPSVRHPVRPVATIPNDGHRYGYFSLIGWSEQRGLIVSFGRDIAYISKATLMGLPEPSLDFSKIGSSRYRPLFDHEMRDAKRWRFAVLELNSLGGKPHPGWTLQQARELASAYNTYLPVGEDQIREQIGVLRMKRHEIFWTGSRTLKTSGPLDISKDLLPEGSKEGRPVVVKRMELVPAKSNEAYFVMLPFAMPGSSEPPEKPSDHNVAVPRVVAIPPGTATIGSPPNSGPLALIEKQSSVTIPPGLFMMSTELTEYQFDQLMNPPTKGADSERIRVSAWRPKKFDKAQDMKNYIARLCEITGETWRLPTEAEWEYACRAGTTTRFASGEDEASLKRIANCWFTDSDTAWRPVVAQQEPNGWGLYDMHGGLSEATIAHPSPDPIQYYFNEQSSGGYTGLMARGGSYTDAPSRCRSASRRLYQYSPLGIRLVLDRTGVPPVVDSMP